MKSARVPAARTSAVPKGNLRKLGSPSVQALTLAGGTGIAQVAVAATFAVTARLSSPEEFGQVGVAYAAGMVGATLIDFGTNALWLRESIAARMTVVDLRSRFVGKVVVAVIVGAATAMITALSAPGSPIAFAGPILIFTVISQGVQVPLRVQMRSDLVGAVIVADRLLASVVFLGFVLTPGTDKILGLAISLCCGLAFESVLAIRLNPTFRGLARPKFPYAGARHFGLSSLAASAQSLDLVFIGALGGAAQAGTFAAVNRWTAPMGLLVTAFSSATTPFVTHSGSLREALPRLRGALWMPGGAVLSCGALAVTAPWTVSWLLGPAYGNSVGVLQVLGLAVVPAIAAQPLAAYLQALGYDRTVATTLGLIVAAQLAAVIVAARFASVIDVAIVIAIGQLAMAVTLFLIALRIWRTELTAGSGTRDRSTGTRSATAH